MTGEVDLSGEQSHAVAGMVREELARRRMSRQKLADDARISISTLEKALSGKRPFTLATTIRLEQALALPLRGAQAAVALAVTPGLAPDHLGAYSRPATTWLEGDYLTLRPSFEGTDAVYAYRTVIRWDETVSHLVFSEAARLDGAFTQSGAVSLPNQSGHIYLVTNDHGQHRMAVLGRPTITGELYGMLCTLQVGQGAHLTPAAAPLALINLTRAPDAEFGRIAPDHAHYAAYRAHLERITGQGFVKFFSV